MSIDADVRDAHRDAVAASPSTTWRARPRFSRRWRSSSGGAATSVPRPRRCSSIRTRSASACAASGPFGHRPSPGRLADGRDRAEARQARAGTRPPRTAVRDIARRDRGAIDHRTSGVRLRGSRDSERGGRRMPTLDEIRCIQGGTRDRVLFRPVRGHVRAPERETDPRCPPRRSRLRRCRVRGTPPARSARCRPTRT